MIYHKRSTAWNPPSQFGVRIRYTDGLGAITERSIVPLAISGIHLSAWCRLRETDRTFRMDRIEVIELERSS